MFTQPWFEIQSNTGIRRNHDIYFFQRSKQKCVNTLKNNVISFVSSHGKGFQFISWVVNLFWFSSQNKPAQKENGNQQTTKETSSDKVISHY